MNVTGTAPAETAVNLTAAAGEQGELEENEKFAGEFFGVKVPRRNYYFVKAALRLFGNRWSPEPKTDAERENLIWEQLLLSFVAFNQNITVSEGEVYQEITKTLNAEQLGFDWRKDKEAYEKWVKERINVAPAFFENQLKHLLELEKVRKTVIESIQPEVTEEEAHQAFLKENQALSLELAQFEAEKDADEFFKKAKRNLRHWEKEERRRPKDFKRPGLVSLQFLVDLWGIPQDAVHKMMQKETAEIYPPRPIYKGYAVFKVLDKKFADETLYPSAKEGYHQRVRTQKKYDGFNRWFKKLKEEAKIKIYPNAEGGKK